jgi:LDH2 family malate/lactate/ureidoglycolate dehydrogenase
MVDILCAVLCGASFGQGVFDTAESSARVSHFFGAIDISRFRDPEDFRRDMDSMLAEIRSCPPADGRTTLDVGPVPRRAMGVPAGQPVSYRAAL